jgi:hypothetical protein
MYNIQRHIYTQNYLGFGLCPSSGILETRKQNVTETWSKGPNRVGVFPLLTWGQKQIHFPKRCVL